MQGVCSALIDACMRQPLFYKILTNSEWQTALQTGHFLGSAVDVSDGFIHFSTADQIHETGRRYFTGERGLVLIEFATADFGDDLKWEASRGGDLFPHLYVELPCKLAKRQWDLLLGEGGIPLFPDEFEGGT